MSLSANIQKTDFLIKTIDRYDCLERLLYSIAQFYPEARVYITDDSKIIDSNFYNKISKKLLDSGLLNAPIIYQLPFDSGLSAGRNFMVKKTRNPFVLLLDDDFVFSRNTKIENFYKIINSDKQLGAVGGLVIDFYGNEIHFEFDWELKNKVLWKKKCQDKWKNFSGIRYKNTQAILNFALYRRELFNDVLWDPDIKICGEHEDFLIRLKNTKWKLAYTDTVIVRNSTPDVFVDYKMGKNQRQYSKMRRRTKYRKIFFKKNNIKKMINLDGSVERPHTVSYIYHYKLLIRRLLAKIKLI